MFYIFFNSKTFNLTSSQVEIVVGTNQWNSGGTRYKVGDIIAHEHFELSDYINDIALIRVRSPIKFNERVQPINYTATEIPPGITLQITGWGLLAVLFTLIPTKSYITINHFNQFHSKVD